MDAKYEQPSVDWDDVFKSADTKNPNMSDEEIAAEVREHRREKYWAERPRLMDVRLARAGDTFTNSDGVEMIIVPKAKYNGMLVCNAPPAYAHCCPGSVRLDEVGRE